TCMPCSRPSSGRRRTKARGATGTASADAARRAADTPARECGPAPRGRPLFFWSCGPDPAGGAGSGTTLSGRMSSLDTGPHRGLQSMMPALANGLTWLAEPAFAVPWYVVGVLGAAWVIYDSHHANDALNAPL